MLRSVTGLHIYYYFGHLCDYQLAKTVRDERPKITSPALLLLLEQGRKNEDTYVEQLRQTTEVVSLQGGSMEERAARTLEAMRAGTAVLHNGVLDGGHRAQVLAEKYHAMGIELRFRGESDLLFRIDKPSAFGDWSYVVADVKSSRTSRLPQMMQVAYYDWLLKGVQETSSGEGQVIVFPDGCNGAARIDSFSLDDVAPSLELFLSERLGEALGSAEPSRTVSSGCSKCLWSEHCKQALADTDDLLRIPGIRPGQKRVLLENGIATPQALAESDIEVLLANASVPSEGLRRVARKSRALVAGRPIANTPLDDVVRDWLVENDRVAPSPLEKGPLLVFIDVAADPLADTVFGYGVRVGVNPAQAFYAEGSLEEDLTFSRFLQGMERVGKRAGGNYAVLHFGAVTANRLARLAEKYPHLGTSPVFSGLMHRLVDVRAILARGYDFPEALRDLETALRFVPQTLPGPALEALGWEPPLIEEAEEELARAAVRIGVSSDALRSGEELSLVWWRMHVESKHRLWTGLIELGLRYRADGLAAVWESIRQQSFGNPLITGGVHV